MEHVRSSVTLIDLRRSLVPAKWEESVRVIGISECREAGLSLAHSFAADDLSQYFIDSDDMAGTSAEHKWKLHVDIMTYIVAAHCYNGIVTTIGPDYDAVALWMPPGKNMDDWWTILRSGMWRLYYQLSAEGRKRYYNEVLPILHHTKMDIMGERDENCYYLVYIGTKPNSQRRGYAAKLLADMMEKADAETRPVYLESSSVSNNVFYKKFGFEPKREIRFTRGPAPVLLSIMVREPQTRKLAYPNPVKFQLGGLVKV